MSNTVNYLANTIREIDGEGTMGAAKLAEKLVHRGWASLPDEIQRLEKAVAKLHKLSLDEEIQESIENALVVLDYLKEWRKSVFISK